MLQLRELVSNNSYLLYTAANTKLLFEELLMGFPGTPCVVKIIQVAYKINIDLDYFRKKFKIFLKLIGST